MIWRIVGEWRCLMHSWLYQQMRWVLNFMIRPSHSHMWGPGAHRIGGPYVRCGERKYVTAENGTPIGCWPVGCVQLCSSCPSAWVEPFVGQFPQHVFFPTPFFIYYEIHVSYRKAYLLIISAPFSHRGQTILHRVWVLFFYWKKDIRNMDKRTSFPVKKEMLRSFEKSEAVYLASRSHMQAERNPQPRRCASSESGYKNSIFKIFISKKSWLDR